MRSSLTIVGASLAGIRAAQAARQDGFAGRITLIGDESTAPYDRPPLSKQVLAGTMPPERTALVTPDEYGELDLDLQLGRRATALDVANHTLELDGRDTVSYDALLIATGARPRQIAGTQGLTGVHTLRTLDDAVALKADLDRTPRRVVVIGAGFIGAEVAATARTRGLEVTLLEALPVPLGRVLGDDIGNLCADLHREHGVDLRTGIGVAGIEGTGPDGTGQVQAVRLADGTIIEADVVVVGVGVQPNTEWLEGSGLTIDNGVVCDETCLAAPDVAAAGDVARWFNPLFGESMRVEHWDHATEMGMHAARRLLRADHEAVAFEAVPLFWSDQYDRKIQLAGRQRPTDDFVLLSGSFAERRFYGVYGREGRVTAVLAFNRPPKVIQLRRMIAQRASWDDVLSLADPVAPA
jgi:3-phenylpropionate/trans-cinnamate dioxygenase ferredoxin reductase subunit